MSEILSKYSKTQSLNSTAGDNNRPYSFAEWIQRNIGVIPGKEYVQYTSYLNQWNTSHPELTTVTANQLKEDYIALLKQLSIAFKNAGEQLYISDIDFDNELDVAQAIPFYSKKLKEIAIYLINKREAIKKAKLKYNMVGAQNSLEKLFYEYLLKAFTKKTFPGNEYNTLVTDLSVLCALPLFADVSPNFQIVVEELYDSSSYFDRDPALSASTYFNLTSLDVTEYLDTLNISPCQVEWLYQTGVSPLCANNPLLWIVDDVLAQYKNGIPLSALESPDSSVLNEYNEIALTQKYLGANQYIVSGGYYIPWLQTLNTELVKGNNWFYWVSGNSIQENDTTINIDALPLSASNLINSGAVASNTYVSADVVFTQRGSELKGAWLQAADQFTVTPIMSAKIQNGSNKFRFPYPGYGLSGGGIEWTGTSFDNLDQRFYWLDESYQASILDAYWNTETSPESALKPIYIYETPLIEQGANASVKLDTSDYIAVGSNEREYAWLYKMSKTDIPISVGSNNIVWPFERVSTTSTIPVISSQCEPIRLSAINIKQEMLGATAGYNADTADIIYKRDAFNGNIIEAAWLSGARPSLGSNVSAATIQCGATQPGLAVVIPGGGSGYFIWTESSINADDVIKHYEHQIDCEYLKTTPASLYYERIEQNKSSVDYNQWKKCNCKAIIHSPLGHPGTTFDDFNKTSDIIVRVHNLIQPFNLTTWKDINGKDYKQSDDFGWFKVSNGVEPDVGWGNGNWLTYGGDVFTLKKNCLYLYIRSNINRAAPDLNVPYLVAKYKYNATKNSWRKMVFNAEHNKWEGTNSVSDMILYPGDYITYNHASVIKNVFALTNTSNIECGSIQANAANFMWNTQLYGWNYSTNSYSSAASGARPFWAVGTDQRAQDTKQKGINIWGEGGYLIDDYLFKSQPNFSSLVLQVDDVVDYNRVSGDSIIWKQPLQFNVKNDNKRWCDLIIDTNKTSNLSSILFNDIHELVISATNIDSTIKFDIIDNLPLRVNYFANNTFTWTQELSNTSLGLPPTGGVWVPIISGQLVTADAPFANLTNRHFPTYASMPYVGNLYSESDVGGFNIPKILGTSIALSKRIDNRIEIDLQDKDELHRSFRNISMYRTDIGNSLTSQVAPISTIGIDSSWMKSPVTNMYNAGVIHNTSKYQKFIPYQSKFETIKTNDNGVFRQEDATDPWNGSFDNEWGDNVNWPLNWKKQFPVEKWYAHFPASGLDVYQWKTDIFGNQYALLKNIQNTSIYDKKHTIPGTLWTRSSLNEVYPAEYSLDSVYDSLQRYASASSLTFDVSGILDFDVWFDTLMFYTSSLIGIVGIEFDYDTGIVSTLTDNIHLISLTHSKFGGSWFDTTNKNVTICTLVSCGNYIFPSLREFNIEDNTMSLIYNTTSLYTNMSAFSLTGYDNPVFTYDDASKIYNISYIGYSSAHAGMYLNSINVQNLGNTYDIVKVKTIVPQY